MKKLTLLLCAPVLLSSCGAYDAWMDRRATQDADRQWREYERQKPTQPWLTEPRDY